MKRIHVFTFPKQPPPDQGLAYYRGQSWEVLEEAHEFAEMALDKWDSETDEHRQIVRAEGWTTDAWGELVMLFRTTFLVVPPGQETEIVTIWYDPMESETLATYERVKRWWTNERRLRG